MSNQEISREFLIKLFGEDVIDRHIAFIKFCVGIKNQLPKHVSLDDVIKQVSASRNYHLISNMVFVHESRLDELREYINKNMDSADRNAPIMQMALESIPANK